MGHLLKTNVFVEIFFKSLKLFMNRILVLSGNIWNKTRAFLFLQILTPEMTLNTVCLPSRLNGRK